MKISKNKALELIDVKISEFKEAEALPFPATNPAYTKAIHGTIYLLTELFSEDEANKFLARIDPSIDILKKVGSELATVAMYFKRHLEICIGELENYKERIQYFCPTEEVKVASNAEAISHYKKSLTFVSMSFDDADKEINEYVTGILKALQINFVTGERYSKDSIPQKVQSRIRSSDPFIIIFVKRDKIEGGGYTTPSWLLKELGIAQGSRKDVIAWVERGIKDIAGVNYEKEVIYFGRNNIKEMEKATIKFLEALKEHKLI